MRQSGKCPKWANPSQIGINRCPSWGLIRPKPGTNPCFWWQDVIPLSPKGRNQIVDKSTMSNPDCPNRTLHYPPERPVTRSRPAHRRCSQVSEFTLTHCLGLLEEDGCRSCRRLFPESPSYREKHMTQIAGWSVSKWRTTAKSKHGTSGKTGCSNRIAGTSGKRPFLIS